MLTALPAPTTMNMPTRMKNAPNGMSTSLKNGNASELDSGFSPIHMKQPTAMPAMANSISKRIFPEKPRVVDFVTFRKSS